MAGDTSDPHDRDPSDDLPDDPFPPERTEPGAVPPTPTGSAPTPDPAAFEDMLRSMGVDPKATAAAASAAGPGQPDVGGFGPLGPLLGMLGGAGAGGFAWDAVRQSALWTAAGGAVEPTVDPLDRIRIEELCRYGAAAVEEATGLDTGSIDVQVTTRAGWAAFALEDHRVFLERISVAIAARPSDGASDPLSAIFSMLGPLMLSSQAGSIVGHLGAASMATYDWPIVRPADRLTIVSSAIDAFAAEWSIPIPTARLHVCVADVSLHAVMRIPSVRARLMSLMQRHADNASFDTEAMTEELGRRLGADGDDSGESPNPFDAFGALGGLGGMAGIGGMNLGALTSFNAAEFLGGAPAQLDAQTEIEMMMRPILGYVDYIVAIVGARLLGDNRQVMEAWKRRRSTDAAVRNAGRLLGPVITPFTYERGAAFIGGIVQRAGSDALALLWSEPGNFPTPAEIEAPGLWLARIGLAD